MIPSAFEYHRPDSVDAVIGLLEEWGDEARVIAGGHSLIPVMKQRLTDISHLVDLAGVESMKGISVDGGIVTIGAMTPITAFQRTALEDTEVGGVAIRKGQRLALFYRSANFDPEVFEDPYSLNVFRSPNPHVGFGGTGAHYCIGANLARITINLIFNAIADHMPNLRPLSPPERLRSGWLNGIKHWQVDYGGSTAPSRG